MLYYSHENVLKFKEKYGVGPYQCRSCLKEFSPRGTKANLDGLCVSKCEYWCKKGTKVEKRKDILKKKRECFILPDFPPDDVLDEEQVVSTKIDGSFYYSREWLELRYQVLKKYGRKCLLCGAQPPNIILHVDHIKPVSKYPELKLTLDNLQVLCEECNLGKSNKDETDWRIK